MGIHRVKKCQRAACKLACEKQAPKLRKLRDSLVPGTVVIILAGRFAGCRAVFLKRLDSGLLLVSGPYKYNGVPLRRIAAAYVIATSTKVDISDVDASAVTDAMFKRPREAKVKRDAKRFFAYTAGVRHVKKNPQPVCAERVELQKKIDEKLVAACEKVDLLPQYLPAKFTLEAGQYPHAMKF